MIIKGISRLPSLAGRSRSRRRCLLLGRVDLSTTTTTATCAIISTRWFIEFTAVPVLNTAAAAVIAAIVTVVMVTTPPMLISMYIARVRCDVDATNAVTTPSTTTADTAPSADAGSAVSIIAVDVMELITPARTVAVVAVLFTAAVFLHDTKQAMSPSTNSR